MYNPNAIEPHLVGEGSDMAHELSERFTAILRSRGANHQLSECKSSDIFELAQRAHEIHFVLREDNFMRELGKSLEKDERVEENSGSTFSIMPFDEEMLGGSIVFSSWTIKTEIGGGSVYDHQLDPYPGALHYVKVSPAYLSFINFSSFSYLALAFVVSMFIAKKRKNAKGSTIQFFGEQSSDSTFCPKPFEIVRRKASGNNLMDLRRKRRDFDENTDAESNSSTERDPEHFPGIISNTKSRSRLSDIINN